MRCVPVYAAAILVLLGLWAQGTPALAESRPDTPKTFDFGVVETGNEARHGFLIRNGSKRDSIEITAARSSCDCVQIVSYPQTIAPGETGKLELRWIPSGPGRASNVVLLETRASSGSTLHFTLEGTARGEMPEERKRLQSSPIPGEWFTRISRKRDRSLLISVESLRRGIEQDDPIRIVDVRRPEDFERSRIPGSLNIPRFALQTKESLKSSHIVIVGEGYDYGGLESRCRELRDLGFTASILEGGLAGWMQNGHPAEGAFARGRPVKTIGPREFFEERHFEDWIIVNACNSKWDEGLYFIPQAHLLQGPQTTEQLVSKLGELVSSRKGNNVSLILFDDDGSDLHRLGNALREFELQDIYFLEGGVEAYRAFLENQAALVQHQSNAGKEAGAQCPSCPPLQ